MLALQVERRSWVRVMQCLSGQVRRTQYAGRNRPATMLGAAALWRGLHRVVELAQRLAAFSHEFPDPLSPGDLCGGEAAVLQRVAVALGRACARRAAVAAAASPSLHRRTRAQRAVAQTRAAAVGMGRRWPRPLGA